MTRGQVWLVAVPSRDEPKYWAVVSQNGRNNNFDTVLGVRITTTDRSHLPSYAAIPDGECVRGYVAGDSLTELWPEDLVNREPTGALSRSGMAAVESAVKGALGIR